MRIASLILHVAIENIQWRASKIVFGQKQTRCTIKRDANYWVGGHLSVEESTTP